MEILTSFYIGYLGFRACCKAVQLRISWQFSVARLDTVSLYIHPLLPSTEHCFFRSDEKIGSLQHPNCSMLQAFPLQHGEVACPALCILKWDMSRAIRLTSTMFPMLFPGILPLGSYRYLSICTCAGSADPHRLPLSTCRQGCVSSRDNLLMISA